MLRHSLDITTFNLNRIAYSKSYQSALSVVRGIVVVWSDAKSWRDLFHSLEPLPLSMLRGPCSSGQEFDVNVACAVSSIVSIPQDTVTLSGFVWLDAEPDMNNVLFAIPVWA